MERALPLPRKDRVDLIQLRNLNIDPEWYLKSLESLEATRPWAFASG